MQALKTTWKKKTSLRGEKAVFTSKKKKKNGTKKRKEKNNAQARVDTTTTTLPPSPYFPILITEKHTTKNGGCGGVGCAISLMHWLHRGLGFS